MPSNSVVIRRSDHSDTEVGFYDLGGLADGHLHKCSLTEPGGESLRCIRRDAGDEDACLGRPRRVASAPFGRKAGQAKALEFHEQLHLSSGILLVISGNAHRVPSGQHDADGTSMFKKDPFRAGTEVAWTHNKRLPPKDMEVRCVIGAT